MWGENSPHHPPPPSFLWVCGVSVLCVVTCVVMWRSEDSGGYLSCPLWFRRGGFSLGLPYWQLLAASHIVVGFLNCTWLLSWVPGGRTQAFKLGKHLKTDTISLAPHFIVLMIIQQFNWAPLDILRLSSKWADTLPLKCKGLSPMYKM